MKFVIDTNQYILLRIFGEEYHYYKANIIYDKPRYKSAYSRKQVEVYYRREISRFFEIGYYDVIIPYDSIKEVK